EPSPAKLPVEAGGLLIRRHDRPVLDECASPRRHQGLRGAREIVPHLVVVPDRVDRRRAKKLLHRGVLALVAMACAVLIEPRRDEVGARHDARPVAGLGATATSPSAPSLAHTTAVVAVTSPIVTRSAGPAPPAAPSARATRTSAAARARTGPRGALDERVVVEVLARGDVGHEVV